MVQDLSEIEVGDLLRATGPIMFAIDPGINPNETLWEGNSSMWPKGTIILVLETFTVKAFTDKDPPGYIAVTPVIRALINEQVAVVLLYKLEIIRKSTTAITR